MSRRRPDDREKMTSLRVGNIPYNTEIEDLRALFEKYGSVGDVFLPTERGTGRPRGLAFIRYYDKRDAEVNLLDNQGNRGSRCDVSI